MSVQTLPELLNRVELVTLKDGTQLSISLWKNENNFVVMTLRGPIIKTYIGKGDAINRDICVINPPNNSNNEREILNFRMKLMEVRQLQMDVRRLFAEAQFDLKLPEKHYQLYSTIMSAVDEEAKNKSRHLARLAA